MAFSLDFLNHSSSLHSGSVVQYMEFVFVFSDLSSCFRDDGVGFLDLTQPQDASPLHANLIKSDGSTLYLTRHVMTVL